MAKVPPNRLSSVSPRPPSLLTSWLCWWPTATADSVWAWRWVLTWAGDTTPSDETPPSPCRDRLWFPPPSLLSGFWGCFEPLRQVWGAQMCCQAAPPDFEPHFPPPQGKGSPQTLAAAPPLSSAPPKKGETPQKGEKHPYFLVRGFSTQISRRGGFGGERGGESMHKAVPHFWGYEAKQGGEGMH